MLKILHIIPTLAKGGAERLVAEICNELIDQNLAEVILVVMNENNEYKDLTRNIPIEQCSSSVKLSILGRTKVDITDFRKIMGTFKPDIIHSHLYEAELLSRWEIYPDVAYFTHCHGNYPELKKQTIKNLKSKKNLTDYYERNILIKRYKKCNNHFIAISHDTELYFKNNINTNPANIILLHNASNFDKYYKPDKLGFDILKKHPINLINVGSFVNKKNQSFLIDVVKVLRDEGYPVTLTLLGDGRDRQKIEKKIIENNLADYIHCFGKVSDVENYLHQAHIYVHSATYEPFGLVILEAMAAGLPVVCLDGKGNRDIIVENYNGFMIWENDAELFSEKIIQLIKDNGLYDNISKNAEEFAKEHDIKRYVQQLTEIYKRAIA